MKNIVIPSLLSGVLLSLGWLTGSGIALFGALIPLLYVGEQIPRGGFWKCFLWVAVAIGLWAGLTCWWVWYATPIGPVAVILVKVVLFGGIFMLYWWVSKRVPRLLAYIILVSGWIAAEYLYTTGELSFPWLMLGNGFANDTKLIQWYEYTGVFGGSLWVLVSNILIWEALRRRGYVYALVAAGWIIAPMIVSAAIYSVNAGEPDEKVKVTVIQPNIDPYNEKFTVSQQQQADLMADLIRSSERGAQFVVMPETAFDDRLWYGEFDRSPSLQTMSRLIDSDFPQAQFIFGATTYKMYRPGETIPPTARFNRHGDFWYDAFNSALAIDSTGRVQVSNKSKLVAGVEKMPFWNITRHLEFLIIDLGGITGQLGVDSVQQVFTSPEGVVSAAPICYESIYGDYFAGFVRRGAQIMFVVTNDGWWGDTPGYKQHFSFARLRAIETRRCVARSANTGISGFIDMRGDVIGTLGWWERGYLTHDLPLGNRMTFYTRHGDYIAILMSYVLFIALAWAFIGLIGAKMTAMPPRSRERATPTDSGLVVKLRK